ncbi:SgcJ/EcaC family oxidoreductase [Maribellus mangrovi]|uniref:SgcJ/EcaC family oxidoreductase n=1 Tax=Maribellus mangrovi TaxID=3133146 RepID=UPI0030EEBC4D
MKRFSLFLLTAMLFSVSSAKTVELSDKEKDLVKNEIRQFMKNMDAAVSAANEEAYTRMFLHTDELAVASQGKMLNSFDAVRDTIHAHMSMMEKQSIKTTGENIFVIDKEHAVITTSKATKVTLKNGAEIEKPYALTILLVKRNGDWKIAHYHN